MHTHKGTKKKYSHTVGTKNILFTHFLVVVSEQQDYYLPIANRKGYWTLRYNAAVFVVVNVEEKSQRVRECVSESEWTRLVGVSIVHLPTLHLPSLDRKRFPQP